MISTRIFRFISTLTLKHSSLVLLVIAALTLVLGYNTRNLKLTSSLTDLFGENNPQWQAVREYTKDSSYGNQYFVMIESDKVTEELSQTMENIADRLVSDMNSSGYFVAARCKLSDKEILDLVRFFSWNFPFFVQPEKWDEVKARLSDNGIRTAVERGRSRLVSPLSTLGMDYFITDPLGMAEFVAPAAGKTTLLNLDLVWGSGNYFFSKDHKALLIVADPKPSGMNYQVAQDVAKWTRERCNSLLTENKSENGLLRATIAGALLFSEQDRNFIEKNINLVSIVSVIAYVILCVLVYRRVAILLMSFIPTFLGLVWATGIVSCYPGELNLISLSFIAILVGLGDDNIVHFFNRVPQEWTEGDGLDAAMAKTIETTGRSIVFCIVTTSTATLALTTAQFKGLSEFGLVLTIGLLTLLVHTLFTVPALMHIWWSLFPPRAPGSTAFRFLPSVSSFAARMVGLHAKAFVFICAAMFILALLTLPFLRMDRRIEITRTRDNPAVVGQMRLSEKFGVAGTPGVVLIQGTQEEVLRKSEGLAAGIEKLRSRGIVQSVFSPTHLLPSKATQTRNAELLSTIDLSRVVAVLEQSLQEAGLNLGYFRPTLNNLNELAKKKLHPITVESALEALPAGLLENSIRKIGDNRYLASVAYYSSNADATEVLPESNMIDLQHRFGPFVEFSYPKINQELQRQIFTDNRQALLLTLIGAVVIVFICFRSIPITTLVLLPILFAVLVTFGILILARHDFSFMALTAIPLIIGLGIDNGIHLTRRFLEKDGSDIVETLQQSGVALLQSNLTTMMGFGALMVSSFQPLSELGLVTAIGVALTMAGSMILIPSIAIVFGIRRKPRISS